MREWFSKVRRHLFLSRVPDIVSLSDDGDVQIWLTDESVDVSEVIEGHDALSEDLDMSGCESYSHVYRSWGRVKTLRAKIVCEPEWRWPKVKVDVDRNPMYVIVAAGWRFTCYSLHIMWKPRKVRLR